MDHTSQFPASTRRLAVFIMLVSPLFFSSNLIFGRAIAGDIGPFTLAFLRWTAVFVLLLPFAWQARRQLAIVVVSDGWLLLVLGFLGMWICGAAVYIALDTTTATNGTLIYTTSPIFIILIERIFRGRSLNWREMLGTIGAFFGVAVIVFKGSWATFTSMSFNFGDLILLGCAVAWAGYSVLFRREILQSLPIMALFATVCAAGSLTLLPFAIYENASASALPTNQNVWLAVAGIILIASLLAFSGFQYGIRVLGSSVAGVFMYLLPVYGVALSVILLGEVLQIFHLIGIAMVLGGVIFATAPRDLLGRLFHRNG